MSKSKHTPGPWHFGYQIDGYTQIDASEWANLAAVVTRMDGSDNDCEDGIANARLIAAAPDMYEALELILNSSVGIRVDALVAADAALAKARG